MRARLWRWDILQIVVPTVGPMRMPAPGQMSIWWVSKKDCRRTNTANSTDTIEEERVNSLWFPMLLTTKMKILPRNTHHDHFRRICVKISEISSTPGETQDGARSRRSLYKQLNLFFTFEGMADTHDLPLPLAAPESQIFTPRKGRHVWRLWANWSISSAEKNLLPLKTANDALTSERKRACRSTLHHVQFRRARKTVYGKATWASP